MLELFGTKFMKGLVINNNLQIRYKSVVSPI